MFLGILLGSIPSLMNKVQLKMSSGMSVRSKVPFFVSFFKVERFYRKVLLLGFALTSTVSHSKTSPPD